MTCFLITESQLSYGLQVDADLSIKSVLSSESGLQKLVNLLKQDDQESDCVVQYDSTSEPLIKWLKTYVTFRVVIDEEFQQFSPFSNVLNLETEDIKTLLFKKQEDVKIDSELGTEGGEMEDV